MTLNWVADGVFRWTAGDWLLICRDGLYWDLWFKDEEGRLAVLAYNMGRVDAGKRLAQRLENELEASDTTVVLTHIDGVKVEGDLTLADLPVGHTGRFEVRRTDGPTALQSPWQVDVDEAIPRDTAELRLDGNSIARIANLT